MNRNLRFLPKKVWERLSGIEPRRLWTELTKTQNELTNTQNELADTHPQRHNRIHQYVAVALVLVSPEQKASYEITEAGNPNKSLFTEFGSGKDTRHSYGEIYFDLLKGKESKNTGNWRWFRE